MENTKLILTVHTTQHVKIFEYLWKYPTMQNVCCLLFSSVNRLKDVTVHVAARVTAAIKRSVQVFRHVAALFLMMYILKIIVT